MMIKDETEKRSSHWPEGVSTIPLDRLDDFGIDNDDNLYWRGKPVRLVRMISLSGWQRLAAAVTAIGVLTGGIGALLSGLAALFAKGR